MARRAIRALLAIVVILASSATAQSTDAEEESAAADAHVKVRLRGVRDRVEIVRGEGGTHRFLLHTDDGDVQELTPEEFADRVFAEQSRQSWWNRLLNVTSPVGIAWVALGFLGQLLFTGRMLVQWLASERRRRSVVPPVFWWMSLGGASMLLVYFVWRRDIVGVIGQTTGWIIYLRNLWLIYRSGGDSSDVTGDPGPEPGLSQS